MSHTVFKSLMVVALGALLGGCGLTQAVTDTTTATATAVFYKQVKTLHLDFTGRAAMNLDAPDMSALSVPTMVRVYQLRDSKSVEKATYDRMLNDGYTLLGADLLDERALVVKPGEGAQLNVPLEKGAEFVTVVAFFREPDIRTNTWRLTLNRNDLDPDRARVIELRDNRLSLRPVAQE